LEQYKVGGVFKFKLEWPNEGLEYRRVYFLKDSGLKTYTI